MRSLIVSLTAAGIFGWGTLQAKEVDPGLRLAVMKSAREILASEESLNRAAPKAKVKFVFDALVKAHGVENRLVVAQVLTEMLPEDHFDLVARRVHYYSPVGAEEIAAALADFRKRPADAKLREIPQELVHASPLLTATGDNTKRARKARLPQVSDRRLSASLIAAPSLPISLQGTIDGAAATATLASHKVEGSSEAAPGYTVTDSQGGLFGVYLGISQVGPKEYRLSKKLDSAGGAGAANLTLLTP